MEAQVYGSPGVCRELFGGVWVVSVWGLGFRVASVCYWPVVMRSCFLSFFGPRLCALLASPACVWAFRHYFYLPLLLPCPFSSCSCTRACPPAGGFSGYAPAAFCQPLSPPCSRPFLLLVAGRRLFQDHGEPCFGCRILILGWRVLSFLFQCCTVVSAGLPSLGFVMLLKLWCGSPAVEARFRCVQVLLWRRKCRNRSAAKSSIRGRLWRQGHPFHSWSYQKEDLRRSFCFRQDSLIVLHVLRELQRRCLVKHQIGATATCSKHTWRESRAWSENTPVPSCIPASC